MGWKPSASVQPVSHQSAYPAHVPFQPALVPGHRYNTFNRLLCLPLYQVLYYILLISKTEAPQIPSEAQSWHVATQPRNATTTTTTTSTSFHFSHCRRNTHRLYFLCSGPPNSSTQLLLAQYSIQVRTLASIFCLYQTLGHISHVFSRRRWLLWSVSNRQTSVVLCNICRRELQRLPARWRSWVQLPQT